MSAREHSFADGDFARARYIYVFIIPYFVWPMPIIGFPIKVKSSGSLAANKD